MSTGTGPRVTIVQLPRETLDALADRDLDRARATSPVELSDWLGGPECAGVWRRRSRQTAVVPGDVPWVTGVVRDDATGRAVGRAGFHAAPDDDGMLELGYAIDPSTAAAATRARPWPAWSTVRTPSRPSSCCAPPSPPPTTPRWR